jgi:RNA polymerase sigma-70 factor (ECF subfamily)
MADKPHEMANEHAPEPSPDRTPDSPARALPIGETPDGPGASGAIAPLLSQLVAEHHAAVFRYAYRLTGSSADAEDVTQQTFLIAQQKLDQVRDADRVGHWLLAVARNAFLKMNRRRTPLPAGGLEIDVNTVPDPATTDAAATGSDEEIDPATLQAAIDELPDEFRIPVLMFYFEEASYRDIAEQLDLPPGTVMSRLSRAKSHLRRRLMNPQLMNPQKSPNRSENGHNTSPSTPPKHRTPSS